MNINLSIIVVTYNCEGFILRFFDELANSLKDYEGYEILVLDNNSKDETVQIVQEFKNESLQLIVSRENHGFSKANNILIKKAVHQNILLLNPDVFGFTDVFWRDIFLLWDNSNPMFVKLLNEDLSFQDCVGEVCGPKRLIKRYRNPISYEFLTSPIEVGMGIMAFMLSTKESFEEVGYLSEDYHMYSEDMDWCYRATKAGYKNRYEPRLQLIHIGGASAKTTQSLRRTLLVKYRSQKKFINKHFKGINRLVSLLMTNLMILKTLLIK